MSFRVTINGRKVEAHDGDTVLAVAERAGIHIPTLCDHKAVEPFGSCRLCMVEVSKPQWKGDKGLMTACLYPAAPDLIIETQSERVCHVRRIILDLLLARCPESRLVQELAAEYGVNQTSFVPRDNPDLCILCGLCTRVCETAVTAAIATVHRGYQRQIGTPWGGPPADCIGCGACAMVCPTGHIEMREADGVRHIWEQDFEMVRCLRCGEPFMTSAERDHLVAKRDLDASYFQECSRCKRLRVGARMAEVVKQTHPGFVARQLGGVPPPPRGLAGGATPPPRVTRRVP
jgi:NADH dehydrogenase/NADH:ubiquinone oxidoreductase subunit G